MSGSQTKNEVKMKNFSLMIVFALLLALTTKSYGQTTHMELFGGISTVLGPDALTKDISQGGAGFSSGFNIGLQALTEIPLAVTDPYLFIKYQRFTGSQGTLLGNVSTSMNVYTAGIGIRTNLSESPTHPYLTINAAFNKLGELKTETSLGNSTVPGQSRVGAGIGGGLNIGIPLLFNIDITATYNLLNLIGRGPGEKIVSVVNISAGISP